MIEPHKGTAPGDDPDPSSGAGKPIYLSVREDRFHLTKPSLKELIAARVLSLFSVSLLGTLGFAAFLVVVDSLFIFLHTITPEQRLVTERVVMTFVTATVVQVGAAVVAIVYAVFKDPGSLDADRAAPGESSTITPEVA